MKRLIPILLACLFPFIAQAQDTIPADPDQEIFIDRYNVPEFPGGQKALFEYLANNVHYPEQAVKDSIEDRVIVQFLVQADGTITDIEVVRSKGYPEFDEEAVRVISEMPKWVWKHDLGESAPMRYFVPVNFKLQ
jgi:protein TonB